MTDPRPLEHALDAYLADGVDELADRVLEAALVQIDHTQQRRHLLATWRFPALTTQTRLAAAAVIGVLAIGTAIFVFKPAPSVGPPAVSPSPAPSVAPSAPAPSQTPVASSSASPITGAPSVDHGVSGATVALLDGRVLLAGGGPSDASVAALSSAEIYDPASGSWQATGSMSSGRSYPAFVRLADGRVLVAGGSTNSQALGSAELFDPATGKWTAASAMTVPRSQAFACLLADGRVLVGGGGNSGSANVSSEIYDPVKNTWSATGYLNRSTAPNSATEGRAGPLSATLLDDGRVLVTGGFTNDPRSFTLYDPKTGKWSATRLMHGPKGDEQTANKLADGRVIVVGGNPALAEVFNPATGAWTQTRLVGAPSDLLDSVLLPNGQALLFGASGGRGPAAVELFDPTTGTWTDAGLLSGIPFVRSATLLPSGDVLVVGSDASKVNLGTPVSELYQPSR
jgi:hypothetical protein